MQLYYIQISEAYAKCMMNHYANRLFFMSKK